MEAFPKSVPLSALASKIAYNKRTTGGVGAIASPDG